MNTTCPCFTQPLVDAVTPQGFCAFSLPVSIEEARSVLSLPGGSNVLALERGTQSVVALEDTDGDGVPDFKRVVARESNLNHGMALYDGYLYASSDTTVYRWPWDEETASVTGDSTIVINNINADGNGGAPQGHTTRTLEFDSLGRLYVSVGSNNNVDPNSFRSRIRRFDIDSPLETNMPSMAPSSSAMPSASPAPSRRYFMSVVPFSAPTQSLQPSTSAPPSSFPTGSAQPSSAPSSSSKPSASFAPSLEPSMSAVPSSAPSPQVFPIDFLTGQVFADGIRNAVAMAHDPRGILWAADTGADNLRRDDLGGFITNDNPAEELLRLPEESAGTHYGYPFCWTEYLLDAQYAEGRGTAWAWPTIWENGTVSDDDCRTKYGQAVVAMQAHSSPLGITFYNYKPPEELADYCPGGAFPESMDGYVFIAFHGSWNREIPTGYKVVYVAIDELGNKLGEPVDLLAHIPPDARWDDGFRPVDVDFDECGRLLVSSDGSGGRGAKIVRMESIGEQCGVSSNSRKETLSNVTSSGTATRRGRWTALVGLALLVSMASMF